VTRFFQRPPRTDVNPEEAVALGAALQASALERILSRRPSSRMPSSPLPDAAPATFDEAATSEKRTTDRMGAAEMRAPRTRTERAVQRGEAVDRFEEPTGAKPIARITKPGAAAPPPIPGSSKRTMMGIPVTPGAQPHGEDTGTGELTKERFSTETTREDPTHDPFGPSSQPTLQIPPGGPLGVAGPAPVGAAIPVDGRAQAPTLMGAQPPMEPNFGAAQMPTLMGAQPPPMMPGPAQQPTLIAGIAGVASFASPPRGGPQVMDVTPRGLGIGTVAGYCEEIIRRNSRVPAEMRKVFSTSRDQQSMVRIRVCQGESRRLDDNVILGDLVLDGLPARPRGETAIEVTFQLDASGILQVHARDSKTGQEQRASLDIVGAQSPAEVDAARERFSQLRR
jgi:molecular chaperone DnaK